MYKILVIPFLLFSIFAFAQNKKPLDHTVYDGWQNIGERAISNDGMYVVYAVNPQEGDGELVIQKPEANFKKVIPRGYNAVITEDNKYVIFKIKPFFQDTRQTKIKKKKADEMPKDTLGILDLAKDSLIKTPRVKSYKSPFKGYGWVAYQMEKPLPDTSKKKTDSLKIKIDSLVKIADSVIRKSVDSIKGKIEKEEVISAAQKAARQIIKSAKDEFVDNDLHDAEEDEPSATSTVAEGTELVVRSLSDAKEKIFKSVSEYYFDKKGTRVLIETTKKQKDSTSKAFVLLYDLVADKVDTVMKGFNECKNYSFDEEGNQLAFVAERDSSTKALQKFYRLWYYKQSQDSATVLADRSTSGMPKGSTVSENAVIVFSKDASKLFFGTAPILKPKDTTLVDFETAKLDIWYYNDEYLQTQQLKNRDKELKRSYTAVIKPGDTTFVQLGAEDAEIITLVNQGNADWVLAESDKGNRKELQWEGRTRKTAYAININEGKRKLIAKNIHTDFLASPAGKFVCWYDMEKKSYYTYEIATGKVQNISAKIKVPLYDAEFDAPDLIPAYGIMGWADEDSVVFVYDEFDIWAIDPYANAHPKLMNGIAGQRKNRTQIRYIKTDPEQRTIKVGEQELFRAFNKNSKQSAYFVSAFQDVYTTDDIELQSVYFDNGMKAKNAMRYIYSKQTPQQPADIYYTLGSLSILSPLPTGPVASDTMFSSTNFNDDAIRLSAINPQQKEYNWLTTELFKWKAYNGKQTQGIVYKPEDFDPKKKYPMICYFYEKLSDGFYMYQQPAPTPSRLNIPFFVSRGYIVLVPDIYYGTGYPGKDAYNCIVSGARALIKQGYIDSTKLGIQGQSWGGYQTAFVITQTNLFKAAWAGAPVANMTSAYGGIRWESGMNRQFQYEKSQSRIGATLWEKPNLYIENSPLFDLPKVKTPLLIMHNDADGAVPWYQGIELFTGLRRLGKPVWMLNYNGDQHNLMERRNRKDIQIREQQFFDWLLKGEKPAKWLTQGVPATLKGIEWGLEVE